MKYCLNKKVYPLHLVLRYIHNYIDPRASIYGKEIQYSIKLGGKWRKKNLTLAECKRIIGDLNG